MAHTTRGRRSLWLAAGGLGLGAAGFVWDRIWHSQQGDLGGGAEVVQAHWLMFVGTIVLALYSFQASVYENPSDTATTASKVAFAASVSMVVGFVWDSIRHTQGTESTPGHLMIYVGVLVALFAVPVGLIAGRTRDTAASRH